MNTGCLACPNVYFDQLSVQITKGNLLEENHYYPFGLPIKTMSSVASGALANRHKYQGNEYKQEQGLNWMDFQARQYDPQLGRFLSVDPLAGSGGQDIFSPYAAMGNAPEMMVDPNGEAFETAGGAKLKGIFNFGKDVPKPLAERTNDFGNPNVKYEFSDFGKGEAEKQKDALSVGGMIYLAYLADGAQVNFENGQMVSIGYVLPDLDVVDRKANYLGWEYKMNQAGRGDLLGEDFHHFAFSHAMYDPYFRAGVYGYSPGQVSAHTVFDILGTIPVGGEPFDIANGALYSYEGDHANAGLSYAAAVPVIGYGANAIKWGRRATKVAEVGAEVSSVLSKGDLLRIENAATRINKPISVVGSRASGKANAFSDWDYVVEGLSNKNWKQIKNSLPGSKSTIDNVPRNIDLFKGPVNTNLPHITVNPR